MFHLNYCPGIHTPSLHLKIIKKPWCFFLLLFPSTGGEILQNPVGGCREAEAPWSSPQADGTHPKLRKAACASGCVPGIRGSSAEFHSRTCLAWHVWMLPLWELLGWWQLWGRSWHAPCSSSRQDAGAGVAQPLPACRKETPPNPRIPMESPGQSHGSFSPAPGAEERPGAREKVFSRNLTPRSRDSWAGIPL